MLAILAVFVFHSGRFFDLDDWHVKNATTYLGVQIWTVFQVQWLMPLVFVISGMSTFYALGPPVANTAHKRKNRPSNA